MSTEHEMTEPTRIGRTWVWADGTVLPVVSGGSDTMADAPSGDGGDAAEVNLFAPIEQSDESEGDPPEPAEPPSPEGSADPFDDETTDSFPRAYVTKLREEAAAHRAKATPYEEVFGSLHEDDSALLLDTVRLLGSDPKAAGERLRDIAQSLLGDEQPEPQKPAGDEPRYLTEQDVERIMSERQAAGERQRAEEQALQKVHSDLKTLGYDDPNADDARLVMLTAMDMGRRLDRFVTIEEAHKAVEAQVEARMQKALEAKRDLNGQHPTVAQGVASTPAKEKPAWGTKEWRAWADDEED